MANENDVVTVEVSLSGGGITRLGFGTTLILSDTGNAWASPELTREYATLPALEADFAITTPEYQAAAEYLGQPIKARRVLVGKATNKPTQIKNVAVAVNTVGLVYKINVYCDGVLQSVSYTNVASVVWQASHAYVPGALITNDTGKLYVCITAGTSAGAGGPTGTNADITDGTVHWMYAGAGGAGVGSNDAIVYNLMNAINALAAPAANHTATLSGSAGAKILVGTGDAAGNWFSWEPVASYDPLAVSDLLTLADVTTDAGVATDLANILAADGTWYALLLLHKSKAIVSTPSTGAAAWCNANGRLLLVSMSDTASATTTAGSGTDCLAVLTQAGQRYVAGMFHPRDYEWFDAAKLGYFVPRDPGSYQWSIKPYEGVTAWHYTSPQQANIKARRAAFYYAIGGTPADGGLGQVESTTYGFIDNVINLDWYSVNLQGDLIDLELASLKVANTSAGRSKIRKAIANRNELGIQQGVISPDPYDPPDVAEPYVITVPPVSDTDSFDADTRALSGVSTDWKLAGAVRTIDVHVNVTQ